MTKKPKGAKYRNLTARGEVIYVEFVEDGKRVRFSTECSDWSEAAAVRDAYLRRRAEKRVRALDGITFAALADRYLAEGTTHLAGTTRDDRHRLLGKDGPLVRVFGERRAAEITRADLLDWYHREITGTDRAENTGKQYLAALAGVFGHGLDLELLDANPVDDLRAILRRRTEVEGRARGCGVAHPPDRDGGARRRVRCRLAGGL